MADGTTINVQAQSTEFSRYGTTTQEITHLSDGALALPGGMLTLVGGISVSKPAFTQTSLNFGNLADLLALDPYSTDYETETTALYNRTLALAYAVAQSGPSSVRGGTARVGFDCAEVLTQTGLNRFREVWQAQLSWAQMYVGAISTYNQLLIESDRIRLADNEQSVAAGHASAQSANAYASQVASFNEAYIRAYTARKHYGTQRMATVENVRGMGLQNGLANGFGMSAYR